MATERARLWWFALGCFVVIGGGFLLLSWWVWMEWT